MESSVTSPQDASESSFARAGGAGPRRRAHPGPSCAARGCNACKSRSSEWTADELENETATSDVECERSLRNLTRFERRLLSEPQPLAQDDVPKYSVLLVITLTFVGSAFLYTGILSVGTVGFYESLPYLLLAFFCLVPGVYHLLILIFILCRVEGFTYEMIR